MISFSKQIKSEILSTDISVYCCCVAELAAYIFLLGKKNNESVEIVVDNEDFALRISNLASKVLKTSVSYLKLGNSFSIMIICGTKFNEKYGFLYKENLNNDIFASTYKKNCCRASFLKGVFLSAGTVINPEKTYNLEFSFKTTEIAEKVQCVFKSAGFDLKFVVRKSNYV